MKNYNETLVFKMHELIHIMDKYAADVLMEKFELEYSCFMVLMMVKNYPDFTQKQISKNLVVTESAVSRWAEKMVKQELLQRCINSKNRREYILKLTSKGSDLLNKSMALLDEMSMDLLQNLNQNEVEVTTNSVNKLLAVLKSGKGSTVQCLLQSPQDSESSSE